MTFKHSVKVPRKYKLAANILTQVGEGGSLKTLLFQDKYKHWPLNAIYALTSETLKHDAFLNLLFAHLKLFESEPRFDPWLAKVLMVELLFGKKELLKGSKPVDVVLSYHDKAKVLMNQLNIDVEASEKRGLKPRYVRVNTLKIAIADAIQSLQESGWRFVRCTGGSYDDYLEQIMKLKPDDFLQDYHVKTVFAFAPKTQLQDDPLYIEKKILLQDKATCLAATFLAPTPGSTILDLCAAPGMKTTHLAALIKNEGTIFAVEKDEERYKTLCKFINETGSTCVKPINEDAYKINKEMCPNVEFVLVDPSCSGSGMLRPEAVSDIDVDMEKRLRRLSSMQAKLLKHALFGFPNAKRVVYSTCSLHPEENENVVNELANHRRSKFQLISAKSILNGKWNNTGDTHFLNIGDKCLYAKPDSDFTTGVFVAVFERIPEDIINNDNLTDVHEASLDSEHKDVKFDSTPSENPSFVRKKNEKPRSGYYLNNEVNKEEMNNTAMNAPTMEKNKHCNIKQKHEVMQQDTSVVYEECFYEKSRKKTKKSKRSHFESKVDDEDKSNLLVDGNNLEYKSISIPPSVSQKQKCNSLYVQPHVISNNNDYITTLPDTNLSEFQPKIKCSKKKKKKRKNSFNDGFAQGIETFSNKIAVESICDIPKKKTKKHGQNTPGVSDVFNSSYNENLEELQQLESDQTKIKKKKKSKKDKKSYCSNNITITEKEHNSDVLNDEIQRKKKKSKPAILGSTEYENVVNPCKISEDDIPVIKGLPDNKTAKRKKKNKKKDCEPISSNIN